MSRPAWLAAFVLACGCSAPPVDAPNLLLVTIDTLRRDHCSAYGYARDTTPQLRAFAAEGARFDAAYAPGPVTGPSHATLFTGLFPIGHGVVKNGLVLDAAQETLAERLRARGYQTAAVVSSFAVDHRFGYDQGFDTYADRFDPRRSSHAWKEWEGQRVDEGFDAPAPDATARAVRWLDARDPARPFLLWVHYFDPHAPYSPPPEFPRFAPAQGREPEVARMVALYDSEVGFADLWVGRLLAALTERGLDADTLVVIVGDHGEGLDDHGYAYHDFQLYEEAVRVPLLLRWPGRIAAGRVVETPVSLVDVLPTLLELLGMDTDTPLQGASRAPELVGRSIPADPERPIFLQRRPFPATRVAGFDVVGDGFAIRAGRWKYIEAPEEGLRELYDLAADPGETQNRIATHADVAEDLSGRLEAWRRANAGGAIARGASAADRARLRAMGYAE